MKWDAKHEHEFVENFKILQSAFDKNGVKRHIDVAKLIKARNLDNLEFVQWIKAYFDQNYNGEPYDAIGRRKGKDLWLIQPGGKVIAPPPRKSGAAAEKKAPTKASAPSFVSGASGQTNTGGVSKAAVKVSAGGGAAN